jgi:hypothetical protein
LKLKGWKSKNIGLRQGNDLKNKDILANIILDNDCIDLSLIIVVGGKHDQYFENSGQA